MTNIEIFGTIRSTFDFDLFSNFEGLNGASSTTF